jgi:hypothetical protein
MTYRVRNYDNREQIIGSIYWSAFDSWAYTSGLWGMVGGCLDHINNGDVDNPFLCQHGLQHTPTITGRYHLPAPSEEYIEFNSVTPDVAGIWPGPDPTACYPDPNTAETNAAAWEILAESNPSVPHINVPQAVGELKDLPSILKIWGNGVLKAIAAGYLSWRWCVKPMMRDISSLFQFVDASNKQFELLKKFRDGEEMRRTVQLISDATIRGPYPGTYIHTNGVWLTGTKWEEFTRTRWGTARWSVDPDSPIHNMAPKELHGFNRAVLTGINSRGLLAAAWELLPWSWLIDWFSNVGTMIDATNNSIGLNSSRLNLMQTTTSRTWFTEVDALPPGLKWSTGSFSGLVWRWDRKWRGQCLPIVPFPLPSMPILTGKHWSILAALVCLRRNPKRLFGL